MGEVIDAQDYFPQHRDPEIVAMLNLLEVSYQNRMAMFEGHSDCNRELERLGAEKAQRERK